MENPLKSDSKIKKCIELKNQKKLKKKILN